MAHTPGPWEVVDSVGGLTRVEANGKTISRTSRLFGRPSAPKNEWEDNARLIAATPDMLAALEEIAEGDGCNCRVGPGCDMKCKDIARSAIAKAKGII